MGLFWGAVEPPGPFTSSGEVEAHKVLHWPLLGRSSESQWLPDIHHWMFWPHTLGPESVSRYLYEEQEKICWFFMVPRRLPEAQVEKAVGLEKHYMNSLRCRTIPPPVLQEDAEGSGL